MKLGRMAIITDPIGATLGSKTFVPPTDMGGGLRFAILADPQGAAFGLMTAMPA